MDIKQFETDAKAGISKLVGAVEAFFQAHPELESDAAAALKDSANTVAPLAQETVEHVAPPNVADVFDAAIAKEQAEAQAAAAKIQADSETRIQALQTAKTTATAEPVQQA